MGLFKREPKPPSIEIPDDCKGQAAMQVVPIPITLELFSVATTLFACPKLNQGKPIVVQREEVLSRSVNKDLLQQFADVAKVSVAALCADCAGHPTNPQLAVVKDIRPSSA